MTPSFEITSADVSRALTGRLLLIENPNGFTFDELADDLIDSLDRNAVETVLEKKGGCLDSAYREILRQLATIGFVAA